LLFNIFINDLCDVINHSNYLLFADDLKVYRAINSSNDRLLLLSDIDCVRAWCSANFMKPNFSKIRVISFTRKTLPGSVAPSASALKQDVYLLQMHFVNL
jgi:hypothetical protein